MTRDSYHPSTPETLRAGGIAMKQDEAPVLTLIDEIKIIDLLNGTDRKHYEASGVFFQEGYLHIVFDNDLRLLRTRPDWRSAGEGPVLLELEGTAAGYEDITCQPSAGRWYCLVEAAETKRGVFLPRVDVFDESFSFVKSCDLPFPFKTGNKGFEGLSTLRSAGNDYLLGLCEGNACRSGSAGKSPGKGRIQVFRKDAEKWEHAGTIRLPEAVRFRDYASLDIRDGWMTVLSQASSAMWVGRLRARPDGFEDLFEDDGRLFLLPRNKKGHIIYGNPEGVAWLGNDRVAVVSDKAKAGQPGRSAGKDQSVHIFRLPSAGLPAK